MNCRSVKKEGKETRALTLVRDASDEVVWWQSMLRELLAMAPPLLFHLKIFSIIYRDLQPH